MIPAKGRRVVQTRVAISLPLRVYAKIVPRSGLAVRKFIDSAVDFLVQVGDRIAQLILEKIKTPAVQKIIVLSATESGSGGFGSIGLQSSDPSTSVKQKENRAENIGKV